jgi:endoglucanase
MSRISRRNILVLVLVLAATGGIAFAPAAAGSGPGIRLGVCDWTIGKSGDPAALGLAGSLGLDGVQVSLVPDGPSLALADPARRRAYLEAAERTGVAIASFAIGDLNDVPLKNDPRAETWLGQGIEIAAAMNVKVILVPFFGKGDLANDPAGVDATVAALKRLAPKAEKAGVTLALENWLSAGDNLKILERVGSPAVRVYYDVANSQDAGHSILDEIRLLKSHIAEFHAKDTKDLYGKGSMDFPAVRRAMEDIGYGGWLVMEGTKMPLGVEKSVRYDTDYLRSVFAAEKARAGWVLNEAEYFEKDGLSVLVFHDIYPEGKQGGLEIIQHGERVAALGDVRLEPAPGQWGKLPTVGKRVVDRTANRAEVPLNFEKEGISYKVRVEPDGDALVVTVDLERPLPKALVGKAGFNLELFPSAYFGKTYHLGRTDGVFPRQGNGPNTVDQSAVWATPLAEGPVFTAAAEDPMRRLTIESFAGDLRFFDGRSTETNGWFLVRSPIRAGATKGAVRWRITPNSVAGWRRQPVIGISQVGYHPAQDKRAIVELDPRTAELGAAALYKVDAAKGLVPVLERPLARWGRFLRYDYAIFDFTAVREPGAYVVRYRESETSPFLISSGVYRQGVWQPTLETFLPVQMCHVRVIDRGRIWHGFCHMDDALQAPPGLDIAFIEGYKQGPATATTFAADEHIPGLDRGGWHDAADHDLAGGAQAWATQLLALSRETFGLDSDQTSVDAARRNVILHVPDGKPDILQQVVHGVENLLGGYRAAGHSFTGITDPSLEQYGTLGEPASLTDNRLFDPSLKADEVKGDRSGRRDDRYAFTGRDTGMEYAAAAALAASSRVLRGFDNALAGECLKTAVKAWDFEQTHPPAREPNPYVPDRADAQEVLAATELLITTREARFAERLKALLPVVEAQVQEVGWAAARAIPYVRDAVFAKRVGAILAGYAAKLETELAKTPYGVPFEPRIWGVTWDIQEYAVRQYFLHRAFPKEFGRENVLRVLNYVLGCHPASATSLVSAVGAKSMTVAYGINLNDWTHIPGGGVSGPSLIRPDFPELKEPFPYLWQQAEYVLTGAATYVFTVLAADRLLNEGR